jgi:uncharacterized membrane-anchored protein
MELSDQERKEIEYKLDEISNQSDNLTAWEHEFIVSVTDQLINYNRLSEKQVEIIENIHKNLK